MTLEIISTVRGPGRSILTKKVRVNVNVIQEVRMETSLHAQTLYVMKTIVNLLEMMTPAERAIFDCDRDAVYISQLDQFVAHADSLTRRMERRND